MSIIDDHHEPAKFGRHGARYKIKARKEDGKHYMWMAMYRDFREPHPTTEKVCRGCYRTPWSEKEEVCPKCGSTEYM